MINDDIDFLCNDIIAKKLEVKELQDKIRELEEDIIGKLDSRTEGTVSTKGDNFSVIVKYGLNRTIDEDILREVYNDESMLPVLATVISSKPKLELAAYRKLEDSDKDAFLKISAAIKAKPAKTSVTIKKLENEKGE